MAVVGGFAAFIFADEFALKDISKGREHDAQVVAGHRLVDIAATHRDTYMHKARDKVEWEWCRVLLDGNEVGFGWSHSGGGSGDIR